MYNGIAVWQQTCRLRWSTAAHRRSLSCCSSKKGPAVVEIPVNFGFQEIDENSTMDQVLTSVHSSLPWTKLKSTKLLKSLNAERPVIYAGYGGVKAGEVITEFVT